MTQTHSAIRRFSSQLAAIALSALLTALANPAGGQMPALALIGFAPWLAAVDGLRWRGAALSGLLFGMAYMLPLHWSTFVAAAINGSGPGWQAQWQTLAMFVCFALPFALYGLLNAILPSRWKARPVRRPLLQAALLASLICLVWAPFPYTPAVALTAWPAALQLASLGGEASLLWLMLWPSALLAWLWRSRSHWREGLPAVAALTLALMLAMGFGHWRLAEFERAESDGAGRTLSALPLQLDLPDRASPLLLLRNQANGNRSALELSRQAIANAPRCELVLWPELPLSTSRSQEVCAQAPSIAQKLGLPLLLQCLRASDERWLIEAQWWWPDGSKGLSHSKSALITGYEVSLSGKSPYQPGTPGTVLELDSSRKMLPTLCYELHSRAHLRRGVLNGAQFVLHMASFTPFERHPIDIWDQAMAQLRAVEFGVPIVRSANRGPAGWIDAGGRIRSSSARLGRHAECVDIWAPAAGPTLYTHLAPAGSVLPALLALMLLLPVQRQRGGD
jgi:apolipoprotein N-acyltransferase